MNTMRCVVAYVDFDCDRPLSDVGKLLSEQLFGGIEFIGENTGIWDGVPAVRLAQRFLGLQVELGGQDGSYGLELEPVAFPWSAVKDHDPDAVIADISDFVAHMLVRIP